MNPLDLSLIPTKDLVAELKKREGVDSITVAPHTQTLHVLVDNATVIEDIGPMIVLVITD